MPAFLVQLDNGEFKSENFDVLFGEKFSFKGKLSFFDAFFALKFCIFNNCGKLTNLDCGCFLFVVASR